MDGHMTIRKITDKNLKRELGHFVSNGHWVNADI